MAAIDLSLQTLVLDEAVDEARGLSSLPPELIVHCCRLGTARSHYASMTSVCRAVRQALMQIDNKVWMGWAFKRFRRLKLLMGNVRTRDDIDWKRVYKAQLAAEAVPRDQAVQLTSTVEDFTFNVQITRGPRATEEAGKVEFEWAGKIEDIGGGRGRAKLRLWNEEEERPLWFREGDKGHRDAFDNGHDLRLNIWVSKFAAHMPITVCLMDDVEVEQHFGQRHGDNHIFFEPTHLPCALKGKVDARNDALQIDHHQQVIPECEYLSFVFIEANGLVSDVVASANDESGIASISFEQVLMYLQQSVPWNSEP